MALGAQNRGNTFQAQKKAVFKQNFFSKIFFLLEWLLLPLSTKRFGLEKFSGLSTSPITDFEKVTAPTLWHNSKKYDIEQVYSPSPWDEVVFWGGGA